MTDTRENLSPALLFSCRSHPQLSTLIAQDAGLTMGKLNFIDFPDGELGVEVHDDVRGKEVFVLQTIAQHPSQYLFELFIVLDALMRAAAKSVYVIMPYFGYARQDKRDHQRGSISAKLMADLLQAAGASHLMTMDLHAEQIEGFFNIPVDHLSGRRQLAQAVLKEKLNNPVVLAPDLGAIKLARAYADDLGAEFAVMDKRRISPESVEMGGMIGHVKGRDVLIVDDLISTGETLFHAAQAAKNGGANKIIAAATHALFVEGAKEKLKESLIEKLFITDTIATENGFEIVSVAGQFANAIKTILS